MSKVAHSIQEKARTGDVQISESVNFSSLLLSDNVLNGLKNSGFVRPSPIQLKAIPLGRCGLDLIVQAKSGTGKTCVFSVISLESIATDTASTQVLVLAPTREIAVQIWEVINSIGSATKDLECHTFIGGLPLHEDRIKLKKCHIAVGTPGRIKQLIEGGVLRTDSLRLFILDEADKLLEESFQEQINWIYSTLPENKQMLALSATYPEYLADHLVAYMRNPTFLRLNISDPALLGIRQYYKTVAYHPLSHVVFEEKSKVLSNILSSVSFQQCLIFSNLQTRAQSLTDSLTNQGWPTACIAGCLDQKDRNDAMAKLKTYKCRILISTDLTSRGIDADKVNMVINLDVPKDHETYLHRIGRAGRFGSFGIAVTLISDGQEKLSLDLVEKQCNTQIYPLPDPLPSDLAKPGSPINLDDVVSSEVIHTEKDSGNKTSQVKDIMTNLTRPFLGASACKENRNENFNVRSFDDASFCKDDISIDNFSDKEDVLKSLKHVNTDETVAKSGDRKSLVNDDDLDMDLNTEERTAVCYEDIEYLDEMTDIDSRSINIGILTNKKMMEEKSMTNRKFRKSKSGNSIGDSLDETEVETKEKLPFVNNTRSNGNLDLLVVSSGLNDNVDSLKDSDESVSQPETPVKTDFLTQDYDATVTSRNRTLQTKEVVNLHSFSNCNLSASSFEKVNVVNVFKNSTGFKRLSKPHSCNSAKESLKMFREKLDNDEKTLNIKENCSIPIVKNENSESESLQDAITQVQDLLENRLYIQASDINTTSDKVKTEKASESDSISSEDEFEAKRDVLLGEGTSNEAKEDLLNEESRVTAGYKVEVENKSEINVEEHNITKSKEENTDKCVEKQKENVKKRFQKPKKQRFGFQRNFAIGHLLQQERGQECKTENALNAETGNEDVIELKQSDPLKVITDNVQRVPDKNFHIPNPLYSGISGDQRSPQSKVQEQKTMSFLRNEGKNSGTSSIIEDDVGKGNMREEVFSINNERSLETHSDSVSSTTDSESTDKEVSAIPKTYTRTKKSPESRSRFMERIQRYRESTRSDTRSEDSGVYSRSSYQDQWKRWYKQYEEWHQQSMNMWGYQGMSENPAQNTAMQGRGNIPGWQYPSQSMYYPYQNYHHPNYHPSYHPNYQHNYPYDYSMYYNYQYQDQNSSELNEQMRDAFQFQEDYIREMSKCSKK